MYAIYKTRQQRPIIIKWLKQSDKLANKAVDFIRKYYNENEPLFRYININCNDNDRRIMDQVYERCIQCDASIIALDNESKQIVSVILQEVKNCNKFANIDGVLSQVSTMKASPLLQVYRQCVASISKEVKVQYPHAKNIVEHAFGATHPAFLYDGLISMGVDFFHVFIAKELRCDLVYAICSSNITTNMMKRRGYREIWKIGYNQIKDGDQCLFNIPPPHESINCQVLELPKYIESE